MFPNQSIRSVGITVVLLASCVCGRSLPAQPPVAYKPWPVDATLEAKKRDVFSALERGNFDANRAENEKFFKSYYFARWTDSANESNLYSFRNDFLKTDAGKITGNARNYLLGYALAELGAIAADKAVFPAGRYNAILAIGMLDQKAGESSSSQPTAYPEALPYLVKEHENTENAPFIRLGALLGIVRHAQSGIGDAAQRQAVFALLCRVLDEGKPNEERSADDQEMLDWNRSLAVSGLQSLRMTGAQAEGVESLLGIAQNGAEDAELRFLAIRALGELDYEAAKTDNVQVPFAKIAQTVGNLAKFLCEHEQKKILDLRFLDPALAGQLANAGGGMGMGSMSIPSFSESGVPGGSGALTKGQTYVEHSIGRLKFACLSLRNCIQGKATRDSASNAATGIQDYVSPEEKKKLQNLGRELQALTVFLDTGPPTAVGMSDSGARPPAGSSGRRPPEIKAPKVTFQDIIVRLQELTLKLNELLV